MDLKGKFLFVFDFDFFFFNHLPLFLIKNIQNYGSFIMIEEKNIHLNSVNKSPSQLLSLFQEYRLYKLV